MGDYMNNIIEYDKNFNEAIFLGNVENIFAKYHYAQVFKDIDRIRHFISSESSMLISIFFASIKNASRKRTFDSFSNPHSAQQSAISAIICAEPGRNLFASIRFERAISYFPSFLLQIPIFKSKSAFWSGSLVLSCETELKLSNASENIPV